MSEQGWEYTMVELEKPGVLEELQRHGAAGWEAVGVGKQSHVTVVLLKRPREPHGQGRMAES